MAIDSSTYSMVAQSVGLLGMALNIVMRAMTVDRSLKIVGVVAMAVWSLHFVLLHAWVGAACNAIEGVVTLLSLRTLPTYGRLLIASLPVGAAPFLVAGFNDTLPIVSAVSGAFGMMFLRDIGLRLVLLATTVLWLVYDVANGSLGGTLAELLSLVTLIGAIWAMKSTPIPHP